MESLVRQLEEASRLEDTVIVLSADHYPYGLTDEEYSELFGHPVDPVFEIYENSLILWSADLEEPVHVDKYCSSLDVMPTLANLFGLEYDSRLMAGRDILRRARPGDLLQLQLPHRSGRPTTPPPTSLRCGTGASRTRIMWLSGWRRSKTGWPTPHPFWTTTTTVSYLAPRRADPRTRR